VVNDIQKARDVLAKWRTAATQGTWEARLPERPYPEYADIYSGEEVVAYNADCDGAMDAVDARLIVGTAGNPDLLDAIDGVLAQAQHQVEDVVDNPDEVAHARRIATAILAAEERMSL
jgi:hypothetical protein